MLWLDGWCLQHEASETKPSLCLYWKEKGNKIISLISVIQKETILPWTKTEHLLFLTCRRSAKMSSETDLWRKESALLQHPMCYVNSAVPFILYFDHIVQTVQFSPLLQQQKQNQRVDRLMTTSSPKIHPSVSWESRQLPAPPPYTLRHAYTQRHTDTHEHTSAGPAGLTNIEEILDSGTIPVIAPTGTHRAIWSSSLQELMLGLFTTLPQMIWSSLSDRLALHSLPENLLWNCRGI